MPYAARQSILNPISPTICNQFSSHTHTPCIFVYGQSLTIVQNSFAFQSCPLYIFILFYNFETFVIDFSQKYNEITIHMKLLIILKLVVFLILLLPGYVAVSFASIIIISYLYLDYIINIFLCIGPCK